MSEYFKQYLTGLIKIKKSSFLFSAMNLEKKLKAQFSERFTIYLLATI